MLLPLAPFDLTPAGSAVAAERRALTVFGAPVELVWLPQRQVRHGIPQPQRPPFRTSIVERILDEEAVWRGGGLVLTPNRFPFARRQLLLWAADDRREPSLELIEALVTLEDSTGGTALLNTIGAAASIPRAHGHLVDERLPFLGCLQSEPFAADFVPRIGGLEVVRLAAPYPSCVLGLRGAAPVRALAAYRLAMLRTVPTFNLVSSAGCTWMIPRQGPEIPAPHFPHALGSSELWGRWCYGHAEDFHSATTASLEAAINATGVPRGA